MHRTTKNEHITSGIRKILEVPQIYESWQNIVGNHKAKIRYIRDFVQPKDHQQILDIGCGTAHILNYLPNTIQYTGYDLNPKYIETARSRYKTRGRFFCSNVADHPAQNKDFYDIVMANALLHHLSDTDAQKVFESAFSSLKSGGYLITHDGVYTPNQNKIAKWLLSKDRGQNVRTEDGYIQIARNQFEKIETSVLHDFYRIPYSIIIMKCFK